MTCAELSGRMPAVQHGRAHWSDAEAAHLAACADCRREWAVVVAGARLGAEARVDADALAARVVGRLRAERRVRPLRRLGWVAGLAAAAAVVLYVVPGREAPVAPTGTEVAVEVPGLDGLGGEALSAVLESLDADWTAASTNEVPSLEDLDVEELERIGQTLES